MLRATSVLHDTLHVPTTLHVSCNGYSGDGLWLKWPGVNGSALACLHGQFHILRLCRVQIVPQFVQFSAPSSSGFWATDVHTVTACFSRYILPRKLLLGACHFYMCEIDATIKQHGCERSNQWTFVLIYVLVLPHHVSRSIPLCYIVL